MEDARSLEDGKPIASLKTAEEVAGEQRDFNFLSSVGPSAPLCVSRKQSGVAFVAES
jgi:hypothetical protein